LTEKIERKEKKKKKKRKMLSQNNLKNTPEVMK